jgi:hypothetical protein
LKYGHIPTVLKRSRPQRRQRGARASEIEIMHGESGHSLVGTALVGADMFRFRLRHRRRKEQKGKEETKFHD